MTAEPHAESYYAATAKGAVERASLAEDVSADVCVIGGGYSGVSTALHLAEKGFKVVLLEANRIGWGASGRNGGQAGTDFAKGMRAIERWVGRDDAQKLWDMAEESKAMIADRVERHGIDCDLRWGHIHVAVKRGQLDDLRREEAVWKDYGYEAETRIVEADEIRRHVDSPAYVGGLMDPGAGHLHPLNYCLGLARAAEEAGAALYEASEVTRIEEGPKVRVVTGGGAAVSADFLVLACNAYLGDLRPDIRSKIMPVGTYIGATPPLGEDRALGLIPGDISVCDVNFVLNYYRLSADRRMLFGGRVSYSTLMPPDLPRAMRKKMVEVFPQLEDQSFEYCWGGYVAITAERTPHLGRSGRHGNIYFAQGFSGHGVALTGIAGKVIAEAIAGQAERFDLFARLPHQSFPGGRLLRAPILAMAMLWYRMRDIVG